MSARGVDEQTLFRGSVSSPSDVLAQQLPDEEMIFLDLRTESYFGLDAVGTRMYRALIESPTVEQAYQRLTSQFEVDADRLRRDLRVFAERLLEQGILEFSG